MISSFIYSLIEKGILGDYPSYPSTGNPYIFDPIPSTIFALILGLFIGLFEIQFLEKWFRKGSLLKKFS
jgi:adenylate cyclase